MEDDLEQQVAELPGERRRGARPRGRRRPRRPPRAGACAATRGSARGPTGSRPGARRRALMAGMAHGPATAGSGATGARYSGAARSRAVSVADRRRRRGPEPADRMVAPGYSRARTASGSRPRGPWRPGKRGRAAAPSPASPEPGAQHGERHDEDRPRRLDRGGDERLRRDDLEAGGRVEARTGVAPRSTSASSTAPGLAGRGVGRAAVARDRDGFLLRLVPVGERRRADLLELAALRRALLLRADLEQVRAVVLDRDDVRTSRRAAASKIAAVSSSSSWPLATQPRSPPRLGVSASELSRARIAKSAPPSAWALSVSGARGRSGGT